MANRQVYVYATNRVEGEKGLTGFFAAKGFEARGQGDGISLRYSRPLQVSVSCLQASVWHLMQNSH